MLVWDLETIPDLKGYAAAHGHDGKSDDEIRELLGEKFPKHVFHSIVCIGALIARREGDHWTVEALGAPLVGDRTERELIAAFVNKIAELNPQMVTFNGSSFDLPVVRYRAMVHSGGEDWEGNNAAVTCPMCKKVFIVSRLRQFDFW